MPEIRRIASGLAPLGCLLGALLEPRAALASDTPASCEHSTASYRLSARLDEARHALLADGHIRFHNRSCSALFELFFHLYLNAFESDDTVFLRSPFQRARDESSLSEPGSMQLTSLVAQYSDAANVDLLQGSRFVEPGEGADRTDLRVPLSKPLLPGQSLDLSVSFEAQLPRLISRSGYAGTFHFVAQWYPKLAKLSPDGTWRHFHYHPLAEYYADFGDYDISLEVPEAWPVAASGELVSERPVNAERRIMRFRAQNVHDFAWSTWPHFRQATRHISTTRVSLFFPPGHDQNAELTLDTIAEALPFLEEHFGPYPYPTLTVVHPPRTASPAGGMEYPTLITTGGPWLAHLLSRQLEGLTIHELGHQWFQGMLASDEYRFPFLDEGLNSYVETLVGSSLAGQGSAFTFLGHPISIQAVHRFLMRRSPAAALHQPASSFRNFEQIGSVVYSRTALTLRTLGNVYGRDAMQGAMRAYAQGQRFSHPTPDALSEVIGRHLGSEAQRNLEAALQRSAEVDFQVESLEARQQGGQHVTRAWVRRTGPLQLPVTVRFVTRSGQTIDQLWDGVEESRAFEHRTPVPVDHVWIDPEHQVELDTNLLNNVRSSQPTLPWTLWSRLQYWFSLLVHVVAP